MGGSTAKFAAAARSAIAAGAWQTWKNPWDVDVQICFSFASVVLWLYKCCA